MVEARRILICVDDSEASEKAVSWTLEEICKPGDDIHLVNAVLHFATTTYPATNRTTIDVEKNPMGLVDEDKKEFKEALEMIDRRFKPILQAADVPYTVEIVQNFSQSERVAQPVLRVAEHLKATAIVVGQYHKGLDKLLHGSTASTLLSQSKVPVIVMR
eukprot:jgi/Botrbrau1/22786/Bobra.0132s0112.1